MDITIMAIVVEHRNNNAPKLQEILTKYGCIIKTRLGLHESSKGQCQERGLIILELDGSDEDIVNLKNELLNMGNIKVNTMKV